MATLPKYFTDRPSLVYLDFHLAIDGGDVRQESVRHIVYAIEQAFAKAAQNYKLETAVSRKLRSLSSRRLRRTLRNRGFQVALEPPQSVDAVR